MKLKLTATILAVAMAPQTAFASMNISLNSEKNSIKISGEADTYNVSIGVLNSGYTIEGIENGTSTVEEAVLFYRPVEVTDGNYFFEVDMPAGAQRGAYTVFSDGETGVVYYASASERLSMVAEVISAIQNDTLTEYIGNNGVYLANSEKLMNVADVSKVSNIAKGMLSDASLTAGSVQSLEKITKSLDLSTVIQLLNENKIDELSEVENVTDEAKMDIKLTQKSLIPLEKHTDVVTRIEGKNLTSEDKFYDALEESLFVGVINDSVALSSAEKRSFFEDHAGYVKLNLTEYNTLAQEKRSSVINQLSTAKVANISAMQAKLDELYDKEKPTTITPSAGGGGGGGSAVSTSKPTLKPSGTEVKAEPEEPKVVPTISFKDMESYSWAETAVKALRNSGIVSGYSNGTYKPQGNVTRAEFVTMIARAFLSEYTGEEEIFSDVAKEDWSYKYVMAAYDNKLVSGTGEGEFKPDENIKRSDMAVILNNLLKYKEKEVVASDKNFNDAEDIPKYASDAVAVLRSAGVISGDENNNFRPADFANRAEAAVMIYKFTEVMQEVQE